MSETIREERIRQFIENLTTSDQMVTTLEAEAGTETARRAFSPLMVKKAIDALAPGGVKIWANYYLVTGGVTGVAGTATTLTINAGSTSSGSGFILSSSEITFPKTGTFKVEAQCYFNSGATSRSEYSMYIETDTSGSYAEVSGTRSGIYIRGYDSGSTGSISTIISVNEDDKMRLRVIRTDGSASDGYQDDNGTRVVITEL